MKTKQSIRLVQLTSVQLDARTQARAGIDEATVQEYAEALAAGAVFPPPILFDDGQSLWIGDGFHRVEAAIKAGLKGLLCDVRHGAMRDAVLFAAAANQTHGLRRSNADKRRAVELLLADAECQTWSDHVLADHAGVSHAHVANVRGQLSPVGCAEPTRRIGADGKLRRLPRPATRREAPLTAADLTTAEPAPLPLDATDRDTHKKFVKHLLEMRGLSGLAAYDRAVEVEALANDPEFLDVAAEGDGVRMALLLDSYVQDLCLDSSTLRKLLKHFPNREAWSEGKLESMRKRIEALRRVPRKGL